MSLYAKYLGIHLRSAMQHKGALIMMSCGQFITSFSAFVSVYFLFDRFGSVEGFTFNEVLICYSIVLMAFSTAECFVRGFDTFPRLIGNGQFDRMLVRPRGEIFQVLASTVEFSRLGRFLQAFFVFCYALPTCGIAWTPVRICVLAGMLVGGTALFSSLFLIYAALSFFTLEGLEFINIFTDGGREHGAYPMGIYGKEILAFYTYVVPLACVQYYPLLFLLDRVEPTRWWYGILPLAGVLFAAPAYMLWRFGVRHYRSTGS